MAPESPIMAAHRAWIWPILLMISIFLLSGTSQIATPEMQLAVPKDKLGHFLVFGLLATSMFRITCIRNLGVRGMIIVIGCTGAFAAFDEFRQSFTPERTVEWMDWTADCLGAICATLVYHYCPAYKRCLEFPCHFRNSPKTIHSARN